MWEYNDEGSIPYVPWFRAPYYVWVGRVPRLETLLVENKASAGGGWGAGGAHQPGSADALVGVDGLGSSTAARTTQLPRCHRCCQTCA